MNTPKTLLGCLLVVSSLMISSCGGGVKDQEGNIIKTVKIGNQEWMAENLNVNHFRNGDSIPEPRTYEEWKSFGEEGKPAWCIIQNDPKNGKKFGKLYNWYTVNDPRGLAPKGWHVPSDEEWTQLIDYLGGGVLAASKMKTMGITENSNKVNQNGFSGLPGGNCNSYGTFYGFGSYGYWWSATEVDTSNAWIRFLNYPNCNVYSLSYNKLYGISVRCLRD